MQRWWAVVLFVLAAPLLAADKPEVPTVVVRGPTIIAFFVPVTEKELADDPSTNEALSDFQVYAERAFRRFKDSGIRFETLSAVAFKVQGGKRASVFRPRRGVGYYFVQPGREPRVEYGVHTDDDIQKIADEYFAAPPAKR